MRSPHFSPRERAAVLWAEHVARNTARAREDIFAEVKGHFSDAELVELTGICGLFAVSNRFQDSLHLPIEEQTEVDKIRRSVRADPNRMKAYIGTLLEFWPEEFPVPRRDAGTCARIRHEGPETPAIAFPAGRNSGVVARVPLLDPKTARGETANFFRAADQLLGCVPNTLRVWAHIPYLAKLFLPFQVVLEREGAGSLLPSPLKSLALIRTARINAAPYSLAHRTALGRAIGVTEVQLAVLGDDGWADSGLFSPAEAAAVRWAEHVAPNSAKRRNDIFDGLTKYFRDKEIVELTGLCALANMTDRFHNALCIPPEVPTEIASINGSVHVGADRLKTYLETLVALWPQEFPVPDGAPGLA